MITFKDFRNKTINILLSIYEESTFYIYRTDTNAVLARGINRFEAAKARANQIRKSQNLKWNQVNFKSERGLQGVGSGSSTSAGRRSGNSSANTYGKSFYVDYSRNYNPKKGHVLRVSGTLTGTMPTCTDNAAVSHAKGCSFPFTVSKKRSPRCPHLRNPSSRS